VCPAALVPTFQAALATAALPPALHVVAGGRRRQDSVEAGLAALPPEVRIVAVQDGARPQTSLDLLLRCAASARERGSGVAARRVTDTIKIADAGGRVSATPERATLWAAETPQAFRRELLAAGLRRARENGQTVTDDAQAVELLGEPVFLIAHDSENPKITFPGDLVRLRQS
jgi:2-C-methyl-D-erythritol 4-phosphate cytidylyltransferase